LWRIVHGNASEIVEKWNTGLFHKLNEGNKGQIKYIKIDYCRADKAQAVIRREVCCLNQNLLAPTRFAWEQVLTRLRHEAQNTV